MVKDFVLDTNVLLHDPRGLPSFGDSNVCQDLSPHQVETIVTRVGHGTKVVLTGDLCQFDNPYLDSMSDGLVHVAETSKDASIAAAVVPVKGERAPLAEVVANIL